MRPNVIWWNRPNLVPMVEWIGDFPVMHGERDVPMDDPEEMYCLCGHPYYLLCPERESGGVLTMQVGDSWGGRIPD